MQDFIYLIVSTLFIAGLVFIWQILRKDFVGYGKKIGYSLLTAATINSFLQFLSAVVAVNFSRSIFFFCAGLILIYLSSRYKKSFSVNPVIQNPAEPEIQAEIKSFNPRRGVKLTGLILLPFVIIAIAIIAWAVIIYRHLS